MMILHIVDDGLKILTLYPIKKFPSFWDMSDFGIGISEQIRTRQCQ